MAQDYRSRRVESGGNRRFDKTKMTSAVQGTKDNCFPLLLDSGLLKYPPRH